MSSVNDIKRSYEIKQSAYKHALQTLNEAKREFNKTYHELSEEGQTVAENFTKSLYNYLVKNLDVSERRSSYSPTLCEVYLNDSGYEKISFHNKFYLSALNPEFTYMIRDNNLKAEEGKLPMDMEPEKVGEFLITQLKNFKK